MHARERGAPAIGRTTRTSMLASGNETSSGVMSSLWPLNNDASATAAGLSPSRLCARHGEVSRQKARKMCVCGRVMGLGS